MLRSIIYARYSSDNQREESISAQVFECKAYAEKNGLLVLATYVDEAKSATTDDRPNFLRMINDAKLQLFDIVLVHKLDRFARNRYDSAIYKKRLKDYKVKLISVTQPLDDSPESAILESVLEGMDEYYSKNLAREAMKGMKDNARKGLHNGGIPPLGYNVGPDKRYIINEEEATIVKMIFNMVAQGIGYTQILNDLTRLGLKTKLGNPFSKNSIHDLLTNEKYNGVYVFNRAASKQLNGTRNTHKNKDDQEIIRIPNMMPRIIDEHTFHRVQSILHYRKQYGERGRLKAKKNYMLSSKLTCGHCGSAMVGNSFNRPNPYSYYECSSKQRKLNCRSPRIKTDKIENLVLEVLQEHIFTDIPELTERLNAINQDKQSETREQIIFLKARIKDLDRKINNLIDAIEAGSFSPTINEKLNENETQKNSLMLELTKMEIKEKSAVISSEYLTAMLEEARKKIFEYKDAQETKNLVQKFVNQVIVYENEIQVSIPLPISLPLVGSISLPLCKIETLF
ncbi:MAG: recombinase family protein [Syntrophomonas sp.]